MKFKLDKNLGTRTQRVFEEAGGDVHVGKRTPKARNE